MDRGGGRLTVRELIMLLAKSDDVEAKVYIESFRRGSNSTELFAAEAVVIGHVDGESAVVIYPGKDMHWNDR